MREINQSAIFLKNTDTVRRFSTETKHFDRAHRAFVETRVSAILCAGSKIGA